MKYLGSKTIETERLILKSETFDEQKRFWEILMIPEVNRYYLTVPVKFRDKLKDWNKQKVYYEEDMKKANNPDVFRWSIFLKDNNQYIGRISCHDGSVEDESITSPDIRGVAWIIDPKYHGNGYGTEAAKAMLNYMFLDCGVEKIVTCAAIDNPASWHVMEKLGFVRQDKIKMVQYTYLDESTPCYSYELTKEEYLLK